MLGTSIAAGFPQRVPGQDKAKYVLCKLLAKIIFLNFRAHRFATEWLGFMDSLNYDTFNIRCKNS